MIASEVLFFLDRQVAFADGELSAHLGLSVLSKTSATTTPVAAVLSGGCLTSPEKVSNKKKRSKKKQWSETTSGGASQLSWREPASYVDVSNLDPRCLRLAPSQQGWQNNFFISSWISDVSTGHDHSRATV